MERIKIKSSNRLLTLFFRNKNTFQFGSAFLIIACSILTIFLDITKRSLTLETIKNSTIDYVSNISLSVVDDLHTSRKILKYLGDVSSVFNKTDDAESQITEYEKDLLISSLEQENLRLKSLLSFVSSGHDVKHITVQVISSVNHGGSNFALLQAGAKEGIKVNQIVINQYGLVGRISDVGQKFSRVSLVTDKSFRISVFLGNKQLKGVAAGTGGQKMKLMYMPEDLPVGGKLITLGDDCYSPSGIVVGYIDANKLLSPSSHGSILDFVTVIEDQCNVNIEE